MIRTQVQLKEDQVEWLRHKARERRVSISELIREGIELLKAREGKVPEERKRKALELVGRFSSGVGDVSLRHDEYLAEAYRK